MIGKGFGKKSVHGAGSLFNVWPRGRGWAVVFFFVLIAASLALNSRADDPLSTATLTDVRLINEEGFGDPSNKYAFSMASFKGDLYVGTLNVKSLPGMFSFFAGTSGKRTTNGAEIWRREGDGWTRVVDGGLDNPRNMGVRKLYAAGDYLYGVTNNHDDGMEVWRTRDGDDWEAVATGGFGDKDNTSGRGLGWYKGMVYVGLENRSEGAGIWTSADGENWEKAADKGLGDKGNVWVSDFTEFKGRLYMGTLNILGGFQLFYTADGLSFVKVMEKGAAKKTNTAAMKLIAFKGRLYVSTMDFFRGFDLYVSDDGENFERVLEKGYTSRHNAYLWQMEEYNGRLYAGTYSHSDFTLPRGRFVLYSTEDGEKWTVETDDAFGSAFHYGVRSMAVHDGKLIIGTASPRRGCRVFEARAKDLE